MGVAIESAFYAIDSIDSYWRLPQILIWKHKLIDGNDIRV